MVIPDYLTSGQQSDRWSTIWPVGDQVNDFISGQTIWPAVKRWALRQWALGRELTAQRPAHVIRCSQVVVVDKYPRERGGTLPKKIDEVTLDCVLKPELLRRDLRGEVLCRPWWNPHQKDHAVWKIDWSDLKNAQQQNNAANVVRLRSFKQSPT